MRLKTMVLGLVLALAAPALAGPAPDAVWVPTLPVGVQGSDRVTAFGDGTVYELHTAGGIGGFYRSKDFGLTWTPLTFPPTDGFGQIGFVSAALGYAADVAGVHRTTDGAATWTPTAPLPLTPGRVTFGYDGLGAAKGSDTVVVSGDELPPLHVGCNPPSDHVLWTSHDGGRRWTHVSLGKDHASFAIKVLDAQTAAAIVYDLHPDGTCSMEGDRNAVYVTHDGGRSWRRALSCPVNHLCTSAVFLTPTHLLVGRNEGSTASSNDGGRTFRAGPNFRNGDPAVQDSHQWFWVQGIAFATSTRGWLSVKGVGTYLSNDAGSHWALEPSQDQVYGLDVGDASAADAQHAVIAGPTTVSTRVPFTELRRNPPAPTRTQVRPARMRLDGQGRLIVRYG